ncbi:mucin-2-like isoform X2 [Saccostrea cucullata]|uniref:mucin-2-like isoform X2 n=1 Tax=Saccostrea cuccullata TaxID=36930 RepID=UPI002ED24ACF
MEFGHIVGKRKTLVNICFRCCENEGESYRPCNLDSCNSKEFHSTTATTAMPTSAATTTKPTTTTTMSITTPTLPTTTIPRHTTRQPVYTAKAPSHTTKPPCIDTDPRCLDINFLMVTCLDIKRLKICPKVCGLC